MRLRFDPGQRHQLGQPGALDGVDYAVVTTIAELARPRTADL